MSDGKSIKPKQVRRKVIKSEYTTGRAPGWLLDLECGHLKEIRGWGDGSGIASPSTTVCAQCTAAISKGDKS